ncbi:hypothetical protein GCM10023264_00660 [Sphingomonas daechungensis]|uniref:WGxxGxxG-CTERM domain-containing protein n=1 Tax=Sphingomonas daechungensis TaxID=1176646 RepID=A0ABX6SYR8_9SPHN|nr:WGxxGxxG family protein [Sphingomonas daechungensis]QNP42575.1 hypothetical protein H9L15_10230 [Sphingomonas daechungensis]
MRKVIVFALAAAISAAPAAAQNDTNAAVDANAAMTAAPADNVVAPTDLNAAPAETMTTEVTEPAPAPTHERKSGGGFPWGIVGLVGLVGLLGRKRRD